MMRKFINWLPVGLWMGLIFYLSGRQSIKVADEPVFNFFFFKTLHVLEYGALFSLVIRAMKLSWAKMRWEKIYWWGFVITMVYAMTDELHQTFVPSREGRARDVIIDALGIGLAWIFLLHILPRLPKPLKNWVRKWLN